MTYAHLCDTVCAAKGGDTNGNVHIGEIIYGDKYGIEIAVYVEAFRMAQQGIKSKQIKEQLNMLYVKHTLLVAKTMYEEGDCIFG